MKRVLITGGSRGIGAATVSLLREKGIEVLAPTRRECDLSSWGSVEAYCGKMPECTGLILNAHSWYAQPLKDQHAIELADQFNYVVAHWMLLRYALQQGSLQSVIGVSSTRGLIGGVDSGPYSMAKAAMIAMIQGFAREYHGVRFNTICPSLTATDMEPLVRESGGCAQDAVAQDAGVVAGHIIRVLEDATANGQVWRVNNGQADRMAWGTL